MDRFPEYALIAMETGPSDQMAYLLGPWRWRDGMFGRSNSLRFALPWHVPK